MRTELLSALLALAIAAHGCSADEPRAHHDVASSAGTSPAARGAAPRERVVHVRVTLVAEDVGSALRDLRRRVADRRGYLASASETSEGADARAFAEIRVPSSELDALRAEIAELGDITSESEELEDVTSAHADTEARLRNARAQEERLLALTETRAATLADVLAGERELARVREGIEVLEAQDRVFADRIAMARVTLEVRAPHVAVWDAPGASLASAAGLGARAVWAFAVLIAMCVSAAAPSIALLAAIAWVLARIARALAPSLRRR